MLYSYRVPEAGTRGTITAARIGGSVRTYIPVPGAGFVYVEWDGDGLLRAVSLRDVKLEPRGRTAPLMRRPRF